METSDVFLGAYLSSYSPGDADSANVFKTSEDIKLELREMIDVSIKEISDYMITNGFVCGKKDNVLVWFLYESEE